jgi:hypothetical protein
VLKRRCGGGGNVGQEVGSGASGGDAILSSLGAKVVAAATVHVVCIDEQKKKKRKDLPGSRRVRRVLGEPF